MEFSRHFGELDCSYNILEFETLGHQRPLTHLETSLEQVEQNRSSIKSAAPIFQKCCVLCTMYYVRCGAVLSVELPFVDWATFLAPASLYYTYTYTTHIL